MMTGWFKNNYEYIERLIVHKAYVAYYMYKAYPLVKNLGINKRDWMLRAIKHDYSKLSNTERRNFIKMGNGDNIKYGSPQYFAAKEKATAAFDHHYKYNDHHPEHYGNVNEMPMVCQLEMICDWLAATHYNNLTSIEESMSASQARFSYDADQKESYDQWAGLIIGHELEYK